jgi:hypothetical protein
MTLKLQNLDRSHTIYITVHYKLDFSMIIPDSKLETLRS